MRRYPVVLVALTVWTVQWLHAQVAYDRLVASDREPQNWLTYSGSYTGQRYSLLRKIDLTNAKTLELKWAYQTFSPGPLEPTPLVVDGVMYLTQGPNDVVALDAVSGRPFWIYRHKLLPNSKGGGVNRGLAILGDTLFMGTGDAQLVAIDAVTGRPLWKTQVADPTVGYGISHAPLVVKDKVLVGTTSAEYPLRCFLAAYDARTGKELWKFYSTPGEGEPGNETWPAGGWERGGGSVWVTGLYDPMLDLTYWGIGNPNPDLLFDKRPGDNLYTNAVVALDPDTGTLKWHFQFTPNDRYDLDAVQIPVLADLSWQGRPRKLMLWANRNGFYYVLDRQTGAFLHGSPLVKINWASGLDAHGRPILTPPDPGTPVYPGSQGATSWFSPSFSPRTELFYVTLWENSALVYRPEEQDCRVGQSCWGGEVSSPLPYIPIVPLGSGIRAPYLTAGAEANGTGAVVALDPRTGVVKWKFPFTNVSTSGVLTTAGNVLFTGSREGYFHALDARSGALLWKANVGAHITAGPMTYAVDGKQYVGIAAGTAVFSFGLRE